MSNHIFNYRTVFKTVTENSRIFIILFIGAILFLSANITAQAATFTVTKTADTNDGVCDADCSLREAIAAANMEASDDVIVFDASVFSTAQTIILSGSNLIITNGGKLTINGTGAELLTISGNNASRIFFVETGANATINHIKITNGNATDGSDGGGIFVNINSTFTLNYSVISNSKGPTGGGGGGGLASIGTTTINNSIISNNTAPYGGGGIMTAIGLLTLNNSTISNNFANANAGGGVFITNGSAVITNSTINANFSAGKGGGIFILGTLTATNITVNGNTSGNGAGGISNFGSNSVLNISNSTISDNMTTAEGGGGLLNTNGTVNSRNSIFADNTVAGSAVGPDFSGILTSQGYNLIENATNTIISGVTTGNITGQDPLLGALQDNGGATQTRALLPGSPAIDAADPNNFALTDQRGVPRPQDGDNDASNLPDIGAFEVGPVLVVTKISDTNDENCNADCSLREAVVTANNSSANDVILFSSLFNSPKTIILSGTHLGVTNNGSLTIIGPGADLLTINGNNRSRIFYIDNLRALIDGITVSSGYGDTGAGIFVASNALLTLNNSIVSNNGEYTNGFANEGGGIHISNGGLLNLNNSTISNNKVRIGGGGISNFGTTNISNSIISGNFAFDNGGGIRNGGATINITNTIITGNLVETGTGGGGGGIYNIGSTALMTITNSTVSNNICKFEDGGGITNTLNAKLVINGSTISNNSAVTEIGIGGGGGIYNNDSTLTLTNSLITGNKATGNTNLSSGDGGGGIFNVSGTITLTNSTISNNSAVSSRGGGIFNASGTITLTNITIANNSAHSGSSNTGSAGGILNSFSNNIHIRNSIVADNFDLASNAPDIFGALNSQGFNLIENTQNTVINGITTGNILGQDPQLLPLGNYGGPTQTIALMPTSPAIDAGDPNSFPETDQRGIARPQDGDLNGSALPDIGAYERQVTIFTVTKTTDTNDGTCNADCSLREAIGAANSATTPDNVTLFDASTFNTPQTITLTNGELVINGKGTMLIKGSETNILTIDANNQSRVLFVESGGSAAFTNVKFTDGNGVGAKFSGSGGAIFVGSNSSLALKNSIVTKNSAKLTGNSAFSYPVALTVNGVVSGKEVVGGGGGIFNSGRIFLDDSTVTNNKITISGALQSGGGGGIFNLGAIQIHQSSISYNLAERSDNALSAGGGGIFNSFRGRAVLTNSTISNNIAQGNGGGINNNIEASLNLNNSTISSNAAILNYGVGGGIISYAVINAVNTTIANNSAGHGAGVINSDNTPANFRNSIIAGNTQSGSPQDYIGRLNSQGYNLIENTSGATITGTTTGNILGVDPQLLPLGNYGGSTQTHALRPTSPAIDKGSSFGLTTDQRGFTRPFDNPAIANAPGGDGSDIGAFERQPTKTFSTTPFDFDGDGKSDISVFRPDNGVWYLLNSSNNSFFGFSFGFGTDEIVPADYDGDGKTDIAVFRPDTGTWYLQQSASGFLGVQFGQVGDIPVPADYDGDGRADIAVYRPSTGGWYRLNSSNGQFFGTAFGTAEDKPTIGDFDGDGRADIAVFRPSTGSWYRLDSSNGQFIGVPFGIATDKPVPADYDGDGKTDIAVFRPSTGGWYRLNSSDGEFVGISFGTAEDKPVPADYDGDGKADIAVYRDGTWYIQQSTNGFIGVQFGAATDKPVPNAFVQ